MSDRRFVHYSQKAALFDLLTLNSIRFISTEDIELTIDEHLCDLYMVTLYIVGTLGILANCYNDSINLRVGMISIANYLIPYVIGSRVGSSAL